MSLTKTQIDRLYELGYLADKAAGKSGQEAALQRFQQACSPRFEVLGYDEPHLKRAGKADGLIGPLTDFLLFERRDCGLPDIPRDADRAEIEQARWPEECALKLRFSCNFLASGAPRLSPTETRQGIQFALLEWCTIWQSPLNGEIYPEYWKPFVQLLGGTQPANQYVLWNGTVKHEVGHALGFNHTPGDPQSVMYPSMRGQWLLNRTDLRNMQGRGYSSTNKVKLELVEWTGTGKTEVWARLQALGGSVLAWSMLSQGSCSQRAEQAYNTRTAWNSGRISLPPVPTPEPQPPEPEPPTPGPGPQPPTPGPGEFSIDLNGMRGSDSAGNELIFVPHGNKIQVRHVRRGT